MSFLQSDGSSKRFKSVRLAVMIDRNGLTRIRGWGGGARGEATAVTPPTWQYPNCGWVLIRRLSGNRQGDARPARVCQNGGRGDAARGLQQGQPSRNLHTRCEWRRNNWLSQLASLHSSILCNPELIIARGRSQVWLRVPAECVWDQSDSSLLEEPAHARLCVCDRFSDTGGSGV